MGVVDRRRHQLGRLAAGIAEHDALVARALILVAGGVDALGDVGGLGVQQHVDLALLPVEAVLLVADRLDRAAGGRLDLALQRLLVERGTDFAGDDDAVGRRQRLAGDAHLGRVHASLGGFLEEQVDDLVGDPVTDLVGMALADGFAGEQVILA